MIVLAEVQELLKAKVYTERNLAEIAVKSACGSDLLSDVLTFTKEKTLLLTGLIHPQVLRTVEMLDLVGVVFVRGKEPSREMITLAQEKGIPLLSTAYPMYEACGLLYKIGLPGNSEDDCEE